MVAGRHRRDRRADPLDDAGALVAEHAGEREGQPAGSDPDVGVAQARGGHPDQDLVGAGLVELHLDQGEGAPPDSTTAASVVMDMVVSSTRSIYSGWGSDTTTDLTLV